MPDQIKKVAISGACGQIAYALLFLIASGQLFGPQQRIDLHLLDVTHALDGLKGVEMELLDCAFPLLNQVTYGDDAKQIFEGVDTVFLLGAKPRSLGMERKDLLQDNGQIFALQGKALEQVAARDATVLVVGNPCHTNCLIAQSYAKSHRFYSMTQLDVNRAVSLIAQKAKVRADEVEHVIVWGNHSSTQVVDVSHATIRGKKIADVILDSAWLEHDLESLVRKRGAEVILARGKSSAASAANAAIDSMKALLVETLPGQFFSVGTSSCTNPYGIASDLIFSFPCKRTAEGKIEIVSHLKPTSMIQKKLILSEQELLEEKKSITSLLAE
ncbi:MAG: malate dehydrogenase [Candidatus Rhabdochlamydia sp.]